MYRVYRRTLACGQCTHRFCVCSVPVPDSSSAERSQNFPETLLHVIQKLFIQVGIFSAIKEISLFLFVLSKANPCLSTSTQVCIDLICICTTFKVWIVLWTHLNGWCTLRYNRCSLHCIWLATILRSRQRDCAKRLAVFVSEAWCIMRICMIGDMYLFDGYCHIC